MTMPTQMSPVEKLIATSDLITARTLAIEEIRALAGKWAHQAVDYDEDTEQQIADGRELLAILERHGLT